MTTKKERISISCWTAAMLNSVASKQVATIFVSTLSLVLFFEAATAQQAIDPTQLTLNERRVITFNGSRERLTQFYMAELKNFAADGDRLELSTLDSRLSLLKNLRRGGFVGNFLAHDLDWDGVITRTEYNSVFSAERLLHESSADAWDEGAASNDLNGDEIVTIDELRTVAAELYNADTKILQEIEEMRDWDLDGDGFVTQNEVVAVINANVPE